MPSGVKVRKAPKTAKNAKTMGAAAAVSVGDSSRDLILLKAKELFAEKGFDGTSIRDIVDAAGVNVSLVSYYFGGKAGLYRECIVHFGKVRLGLAEGFLSHAKTKDEVGAKLQVFVEKTLQAIADDHAAQKIVAAELDRGRDTFEDVLRDVFLKIHAAVAGFLADAQKRKFVRKDLDPRLLASMLQGMMINEARLERVKKCYFDASIHDPVHRQDCARHILGVFLGGVMA